MMLQKCPYFQLGNPKKYIYIHTCLDFQFESMDKTIEKLHNSGSVFFESHLSGTSVYFFNVYQKMPTEHTCTGMVGL